MLQKIRYESEGSSANGVQCTGMGQGGGRVGGARPSRANNAKPVVSGRSLFCLLASLLAVVYSSIVAFIIIQGSVNTMLQVSIKIGYLFRRSSQDVVMVYTINNNLFFYVCVALFASRGRAKGKPLLKTTITTAWI